MLTGSHSVPHLSDQCPPEKNTPLSAKTLTSSAKTRYSHPPMSPLHGLARQDSRHATTVTWHAGIGRSGLRRAAGTRHYLADGNQAIKNNNGLGRDVVVMIAEREGGGGDGGESIEKGTRVLSRSCTICPAAGRRHGELSSCGVRKV